MLSEGSGGHEEREDQAERVQINSIVSSEMFLERSTHLSSSICRNSVQEQGIHTHSHPFQSMVEPLAARRVGTVR